MEMNCLVYDEGDGEVWTEGGFTLVLFQGWDLGREALLEQVQLNFSFRNKFIILLPFGFLLDNKIFSKMWVFKSLTSHTHYGGYETEMRISNSDRIKTNEELMLVILNRIFLHDQNDGWNYRTSI